MKYRFLLLKIWSLCVMAGLAVGCSKDDKDDNNSNVPENANQAPVFKGAAGLNWAWKTTFDNEFGGLEQSQAFAVYTNNNGQSYVNVGDVKVNNFKLTNTSNTYFYFPDFTNPDPNFLEFNGNNVTWEISGGSGFTAFTYLEDRPWPSIGQIILPSELSRSKPFTVRISNVSNADSVIFTLEENVSVVVAGNVTSYTFSPAQLTGIKPGEDNAIGVGVSAYNFESNNQAGKKIYYGKLYSKLSDPLEQVPVVP